MVDIVNQNDKTICLNMIVKNESHIIASTLKNILEHIKIDYWVISDTGSTDDTVDIIQDFFKERGISGEMFHNDWKDFGHNRTKALEHAYDKSDYLFIFDADDLIHGDIPLPSLFDKDLYNVSFGNPVSYHRPILISNRMKWKYVGVLHESLVQIDPIKSDAYLLGNYHIESRRLGDRSKNPNKYVDDALILEKGFEEENTDMWLKYRYSYYCAQSYHDAGKLENAIEWYERTLTLAYSPQYKYCACIKAGDCYNALKQYSNAIDSWSKAYTYDRERLEGIVKIMEYFYNKRQHFMVSSLYNKFKHVKIGNAKDKIFLDYSKYHDFHYFASISGCYCDEHKSAYEACKYMLLNNSKPNPGNTIYNLKFYMKHFKEDGNNKSLLDYFVNYIMNPQIVFKEREHAWNIVNSIIKEQLPEKYNLLENSILSSSKKNIDKHSKYASSKKILIYTGWMTHLWNESHLDEKALGGSEKAVAYLSREFPKDYEIIISGDVEEGTFDNRTYVHRNRLQPILDSTEFHTIIVSRYVCFFEKFKNSKCYKLIISAHDTHILTTSNNANHLLDMYNTSIDKVITLTPWHKSNITSIYSNIPSNKIEIINNGIDISQFHNNTNQIIRNSIRKIKNKFIWSSRSERGLHIVLNLWGKILEKIPDATLDICCYGDFPKDEADQQMLEIINSYDNITHHGKLNSIELYDLMSKSEYWLYTSTFPETSCITAMEMLMSEVVCLYYPLAGLNDTVGEYGIPVNHGEEIETVINLSTEKKALMRENGREYAMSCSWKNRAEEWSTMLGLNQKNNKIGIFNSFSFHYEMFGFILNYAKNNNYKVDIFTNQNNNLGWLDFYKERFSNFNIIDFNNFNGNTNNYDKLFVTTDDDPLFKSEWRTDNVICINHYYKTRTPNFKHYLNFARFKESIFDYINPCYKLNSFQNKIHNTTVNVIGGGYGLNFSIIKRLHSINKIKLNMFVRNNEQINTEDISILDKNKFDIHFKVSIDTTEMINELNNSSYIFINYNDNHDLNTGNSCSGSLPLALSTLCKPIMTKTSNKYLKIENALEFDIDSDEPINIDDKINFQLLEQERNKYVKQFEKIYKELTVTRNTSFLSNVNNKKIPQICVLYNIPHRETIKYNNWNDGFAEAIRMLMSNENYKIDFINVNDNITINFKEYDLILFKESFNGAIYNKYIKYITSAKIGLFISSSNIIPTDIEIHKYDILFYETYWYYYYANLKRHSLSFHAFGINSNVMKPQQCEKIYDNIFVGAIIDFKNPLKMINKPGNNLCIGNVIDKNIEVQLKNNNVIVEDYVDYLSLSNKYNQSKKCFLPCSLHGGGERAVLEARSCNIEVEIDENNDKLKELLNSPIYNQDYYYSQILLGLGKIFNKPFEKKTLNLLYHIDRGNGNFGDEISKFIIGNLINNEKYNLVTNMPCNDSKYINIIGIGSYIQCAPNNCTIFGSGIRTNPPIEPQKHNYSNLNVKAVRGPLSKEFLSKKNIYVPDIYGDPALLLPLFYKPMFLSNLQNKIGIIPHISNYNLYSNQNIPDKFKLICPYDKWETVINEIYSCKYIISSALHGLICSDAYNKPNIWLNEFKLNEGEFKFKDYFLSQNRDFINISKIEEFDETKLYTKGNIIDLEKLKNAFIYI